MKAIKVLQVFGSLNPGGAESRMMDVYRRLNPSEIQFDFIALDDAEQFYEKEIYSLGGNVFKIASPRECGVIRHINLLRSIIRKGKYQSIHAHTSYHCGLVMLAAWIEKVPVRISHARTNGINNKHLMKQLFLVIGRWMIHIFSTNKIAISKSAGYYLFGNSDFEIVPNAIDVEKYQNINIDAVEKIKKEWSISNNSFIIGQIGRFDIVKNHEFTLRWFEDYKKNHSEAILVLIGDGPLRQSIMEKAKEKNLAESVIFTGVRADVNVCIHCFDVLFFPSLYEGLGGVVLEAQAAGVPCVESDTIPLDSDMHLGLVSRCSLKASMVEWNRLVDESRKVDIPSPQVIKETFYNKGYSIESVVQRYTDIYRGNNENIDSNNNHL